MARRRPKKPKPAPPAKAFATGATTGYEAELWAMADALRGSMDAAEYKHVVLGLIFLKYISDAFEETYSRLQGETDEGADPEDPDEYRAHNVFWVPPEARWSHLQARRSSPRSAKAWTTRWPESNATTGAQGRAAQGLRSPLPRQAATRPTYGSRQQHPGRRRGSTLPGCTGPGV